MANADNDRLAQSLADQWLKLDQYPTTKKQIRELKEQGNTAKLIELLGTRLTFGTAGLRGKMEAGFNRMNYVTVTQASQALAKYVSECNEKQLNKDGKLPSVVVGHDHRHESLDYARLTAVAFLIAGFKVYFLEKNILPENTKAGDAAKANSSDSGLVPTPFVPFAVDYYHADVGVMITASHNPAQDNGYKVYWNNGCQIIPPHDSKIAELIFKNSEIWQGVWLLWHTFSRLYEDTTFTVAHACGGDDLKIDTKNIEFVKEEVFEKYYLKLREKVIFDSLFDTTDYNKDNKLQFVYTPMHGVGHEFVVPVFENIFKLNSDNFHVVQEQQKPDPDFPTVKFPNPEEKGALDLAIQTANELKLDLIVANDPDADRFSAAVRDPHTGKFRQLTGNEIGFLFAYYVIEKKSEQQADFSKTYLVNSTVSSQWIKSMAQKLGFNFIDTLTGFKWIGNKAIDLAQQGYDVPFGYEEAIGFMFPNVHDKDGIAALTVFLQLYYDWSVRQNVSLIDKLTEGFEKFGYFKEFNGYYKLQDLTTTGKIFEELRKSYHDDGNKQQPKSVGPDFKVTYWRDLTLGYESSTVDRIPMLPVDKASQMITAVVKPKTRGKRVGNDKDNDNDNDNDDELVRFTARGSGTEPKLKVYIEGKSTNEARAAQLAKDVWFALREHWFKPEKYGLEEVHP